MEKLKKFIKDWMISPRLNTVMRRSVTRMNPKYRKNLELIGRAKLLKNKHKGERCFIMGSGPSLKEQNLKQLQGEYVISISNTFLHPDYSLFRPQYHVLVPVFSNNVWEAGKSQSLVWLPEMHEKIYDATLIAHIGDKEEIEKNGFFKGRNILWNDYLQWNEDEELHDIDMAAIPQIWTGSEVALCVAIFLGFENIYLIGIDHDWFNGVVVHFFDEKDNVLKDTTGFYSYVDSEYQMRRHAYIFRKYKALRALHKKIYNANANPGTYVDVFPKVEFDSLFPKPGK